MTQKPTYFPTPDEWRAWLEENHASAVEILVGFYKTTSGKASITWPQSVDHALCFGWIDGHRRSIDEARYTIRFTPRKAGSVWSSVNVGKVKELTKAGLMAPAGVHAYKKRAAHKTGIYGHEQRDAAKFKRAEEKLLRANKAAWADWKARAPSYRKVVTWWVVSAKKPETRERRLGILIRSSAAGEMVPFMVWSKKK
ncbi:MAG TPA: YdeI/OmpD-associated family protein [bacterium]